MAFGPFRFLEVPEETLVESALVVRPSLEARRASSMRELCIRLFRAFRDLHGMTPIPVLACATASSSKTLTFEQNPDSVCNLIVHLGKIRLVVHRVCSTNSR